MYRKEGVLRGDGVKEGKNKWGENIFESLHVL